MHLSRTPSPLFSLPTEDLISPCAPRLVALTTKYYTPKFRPELQGWREDSELQGSDLRIAAQKPFVVKTKGQWTSQPLYPREKRVVSPGLPRIAHKKSASELLRMPLVPSLGDLYLTEAQDTPTSNPKSTYLPYLRRLDNHSSHHTHSSSGIPNLHLSTDPANPLQLKSRPKVPHLMPSTLLKPAPGSSDAVVDRLIRFQSHDRVSVAVEMDGSPYQERVVLERINLPICRPQRYEKQGKMEYSAEGSAGEEDSFEGFVVTLEDEDRDRNSDFAYSGESYEAEEEKDQISEIERLEGKNEDKIAVMKHKKHKIASVSTIDTPALVSPTEEIEELKDIFKEEPPQTPKSDLSLAEPTPRSASKPATPSDIDRAQSPAPTSSQQSATSRRNSAYESEKSQGDEEKEGLEGLSTSSNLQERQREMALMQTDELMLLKELKTVKNLRQLEANRRKSALFEEQNRKETEEKQQLESIGLPSRDLTIAPSITIEFSQASPGTPPPSLPVLVSSTLSLSPDNPMTTSLDRRASIHEYYPEAIEEEIREEQSDVSSESSRKSSATKGVPTPFATSRRTSLAEASEKPVLRRKSTFRGKTKKPRRSLTDTGGLQRTGSSVGLKTDEEGTNLSSEIPEEEEKVPPKVSRTSIKPSKSDLKSQKSAIPSKTSSRRNSKVAVPKRATTKKTTPKPVLAEPSTVEPSSKPESSVPTPKAAKVTKASGLASAISQSNRLAPAVDLVKASRRVSFGANRKKQKSGSRRNSDVFTFDDKDYLSADEVFVRQFSFALMKVIIGLDSHIESEQDRTAISSVREKVLGVGYYHPFQGATRSKALMPSFQSDPNLQSVLGGVVLQAPLFKSRTSSTITPSKASKSTPKLSFKPKQALDQSIDDSDFSDSTPHPSGLDLSRASSLFELKHLSLLKNIASNLKTSALPEPPLLPEKPPSEPESDTEEEEKPPLPVDLWFVGHAEDLEDDVPASLEALFRNVKPTQMTAFTTNVTNFFKDAEIAKTIDVMLATEKQEMDEVNYKESVERRKFQEYMRMLPDYWEMRWKDNAELKEIEQERFVPKEQNAYFRQGFSKRKRRNQVITSRQGSQPALLYAKPTFTFTGLSTRYYTACASPHSVRSQHIGDVVLSGGAHLVKEENSYRERIYCRIKQERNLEKFALKGKSRRANYGSISSVKSA